VAQLLAHESGSDVARMQDNSGWTTLMLATCYCHEDSTESTVTLLLTHESGPKVTRMEKNKQETPPPPPGDCRILLVSNGSHIHDAALQLRESRRPTQRPLINISVRFANAFFVCNRLYWNAQPYPMLSWNASRFLIP
jgi:hypothetical protein